MKEIKDTNAIPLSKKTSFHKFTAYQQTVNKCMPSIMFCFLKHWGE